MPGEPVPRAGIIPPAQAVLPVHDVPDDESAVRDRIGLCLSGSGYRAMLFHLGAVWRLYETGYLSRVTRVSSVSGGSITAAVLGLAWSSLTEPQADSGTFQTEVVAPIREDAVLV